MLKKIIQTALLLVVLCTTATTYAQVSQAPDGIQFQALATDANGHPAAGRVIYVKDAIVAKTATGTIVYSETFKVTASSAGIFTIVLGKGTYAGGVTSIANIDWANGPFFLNLKIAVEPTIPNASWNVNNEYVDLGTSQFWSVPYAMYAGNVKGADTKLNLADTAAMLKPYFTSVNLKANIESPTFTGTVSGITKAMVGLGNVDNTADINKPVSTATQAALDLKANATDVTTALDLKVDKVTGKALSTNDYTTAEKTKLAAITGTNTGDQDLSALATNTALALKANTADVSTSLATKVDKVTGKELSTNDYTTAEKTKLAAISGTNTGDQINITGNAATATTAGNITATANTTLTSLSNLATVGTITSGVWSGTAVAVEKGGTGLTSAGTNGQVLTSNGSGALSWTTPSSTATSYSGVLPIENGGTSQTTLPGIKSILGLLSNNVAIGNEAGTPNQGGNANTIAIGGGAGRGNQGASSIAIGYVSGDQNQGANSISIGGNAAQSGQGTQAVAIGFAAGQNGQGANAVAIGTFAGQSGQAANSIAINATGTSTPLNPTNAGFYVDPIRSATATTGLLFYNPTSKEITTATANASFVDLTTNQTIAGTKTFNSDITVNGVKIGRGTGNNDQNVAVGADALASGTGTRNTAIGYGAMRQYSGTSFDNNTSVGYFNLPSLTSGSGNTSIGAESMMALTTGTENTSIGNQSLINTTGNNNVGVGKRAGQTMTTGSQNTIIGTNADVSTATLTNATALGYGAIVTANNTVQLGSTSVTNVKTSGTLTADAVTYPKAHGTAGQVLSTTGSGTLAWTTIPAGPIFKQSRVNQNSATGTVDSEIEVGGMAFRYNLQSQKIEVKRITNLESEWQAYNTSRIESGVSQALQRPDIISTGGGWTVLFNSWGNGSLTISGYYHSYEFEMTPYLRGQASDNHSFNIKVLLDGWGVVTLRVIYY